MRKVEKMKWNQIQKKVKNLKGKTPKSEHCVKNAVQRVTAAGKKGVAKTNYKNCGRKKVLTPDENKKVLDFVKTWRKKVFCTCRHIRGELKLAVSLATIARALNNHGYYWRAVPKKSPLSETQLKKRKEFVETYGDRSPEWWEANMDLVLDGVTLTKAPQSLSKREKHAAQAIKAMWMKKGEAMSPEVHTYNRYSCVMQSDMNYYLRATWPNHLQESDIAIGWAMLPFSCNSFVICIRRVWGAVGSESSFMGWFQCPWRICSETLDSESKDGQRTMGWSYSCTQVGCLPSKQLSQP